MERVFPDRFWIHMELRRPSLSVHRRRHAALPRRRPGQYVAVVAESAAYRAAYREGGSPTMAVSFGERARECRVTVAAMVAAEWRAQVVPLVKSCPDLLEVEVSNLGAVDRRHAVSRIRVVLARADREPVFAYGRPPDSPLPRVPARTKALVLDNILRAHAASTA